MTNSTETRFEKQLGKLTESDWLETIDRLSPKIHEVDRAATQIWFRFFPLSLIRHLEASEDLEATIHGFAMQGNYQLAKQIDSSHNFLYGHRFWPDVKHAIVERIGSFDSAELDLAEEIEMLSKSVSNGVKQDTALLIGIVAVGLMTLVQTGQTAFRATAGDISKPGGLLKKSPEKVLARRAKSKDQGLFSFLKTVDKEFRVTWDETKPKSDFDIIFDEEIASGAARDQSQNWIEADERCLEGVIPVECRSAACGTCWVGVVGGADKLSDVERLERKQMKVFGYNQGDDPKPVLRLACQARAEGSVSIVIPPWNGVFGKKIYGVEEVKLEPATTSAAKLRETVSELLESENN